MTQTVVLDDQNLSDDAYRHFYPMDSSSYLQNYAMKHKQVTLLESPPQKFKWKKRHSYHSVLEYISRYPEIVHLIFFYRPYKPN